MTTNAKEPLLLVHGATSSRRCWATMLPGLTEHFAVLAPDLPSHAGQPRLRPFTIDRAADALETVLDDAGHETAHLVGNSLGGWIAMELARRGRARSAVLLSPAGGWPVGETRVPKLFRSMRRQLVLGERAVPVVLRSPTLRRRLLLGACEHGDRLETGHAIAIARDALASSLLEDMPQPIAAQTEPFGDLGIPILLAWGEHDRILPMPRYSDTWRTLIPAATWRVLPGVGHVPMFDDPALITSTVVDWVTRASGTSQAS